MADNADEELDSTNQSEEESVKTDEIDETDDQSESEDLEVLREKNKKLYERTKKAEAEAKLLKAERLKKEEKAKVEPSEKQDVSTRDMMALINAKVTEDEDIDEVKDYAKHKGISVSEALKTTVVKTILAEKAEQRTTAQATNTGAGRRANAKLSDDALLDNADKGRFPEDADVLAEARMSDKLKKLKK